MGEKYILGLVYLRYFYRDESYKAIGARERDAPECAGKFGAKYEWAAAGRRHTLARLKRRAVRSGGL